MATLKTLSRYRWVILSLTFVSQFSNAVAVMAVPPLAPIFQPELGLSKAEVGIFSSAAFAGAWGVLLVAGSLTDRLGVRRMMSAGQIVAGSLVLLMSTVGSFLQAVAVLFAVGLGRGAVGPGIAKAVLDWFPATARATAMGFNQAAIPMSGVATALILPGLALAVGWRSAIAAVGIAILLGGIATALLYRDVREPAVAAVPRGDPRSGLRLVARNRSLWILGCIGALLGATQFTLSTYLALYFNEVVLVSVVPDPSARIIAAGGYLALCQAAGVPARVLWGMVSDRLFHGRRLALLAIVGALSAMMSLLVSTLGSGYPAWLLSAIVLAYGATAMGWQGLYMAVSAETAGRKYAATGVGLSMTCTYLGLVGGPPLFGFILDVTGSYPTAWTSVSGMCAVATLTAGVMARREKPATVPTSATEPSARGRPRRGRP